MVNYYTFRRFVSRLVVVRVRDGLRVDIPLYCGNSPLWDLFRAVGGR